MSKYLKLMRVKHYLKNGLIFLPLIFSGQMFNLELILKTSIAFVAFSLSASVIYIINDLNDIENDRNHSTKKTRPLASGAISVKKAILLAIILFILSILMNYIIAGKNLLLWSILLLYIFSNFLYSKGLKNIALLDVFILVLGYILRLFYGALTIDVIVSSWLYLTVTTISFYLGFGKRRNEIKKQGSDTRKVLQQYNLEFLDKNMYMFLGLTITFYSLWCEAMVKSIGSPIFLATVPLVIIICLKYSLLIEKDSDGDPIEVVFSDRILLLLIFIYVLAITIILYGIRINLTNQNILNVLLEDSFSLQSNINPIITQFSYHKNY